MWRSWCPVALTPSEERRTSRILERPFREPGRTLGALGADGEAATNVLGLLGLVDQRDREVLHRQL